MKVGTCLIIPVIWGIHVARMGKLRTHQFWSENLKVGHMGDLGIDRRMSNVPSRRV
jgi:hypothetical protein